MDTLGLILFILGVVILFITVVGLDTDANYSSWKIWTLGLVGMIILIIGCALLVKQPSDSASLFINI